MGTFSFSNIDGLGLDVQGIVDQIIAVDSQPIFDLQDQQAELQSEIDAFNTLSSNLSTLSSKLSVLNSPESFATRTAKSSNEEVLTATASSEAIPGAYQILVNRLALLDNFVSDTTFTASNASIGTGSFDLTVGSTVTTITISSSNNTLTGLRDAINSSGANVIASVVNDGTGNRLTITSKESGSANAISISNNTLTLADSSPFTFSRTHQIGGDLSLLDASLTVNGLAITSSDNEVEGVIQGVTLKLSGTSTTNLNLTVSNDTDKVKASVGEFVDAYNDIVSFINAQFTFDASTGTAGVLAGDPLVRSIQSDLARTVSRSVSGLQGPLNNLAAAGVKLNNDGTLEVDEAELDDNLANNFAAIKDLFVATGKPSDGNVAFLGLSSNTQAGSYQVDITQLSETAQVVSPNAIPATLGVNETLTVSFRGLVSTVNLTSAMTIDNIVSTLNTQFDTDGLALSASKDASNQLVISSDGKGSDFSFTVVSDVDGAGTGFGTAGVSDSGVDVAGTFTDTTSGEVFTAKGTGDVLLGTQGSAKDLTIKFNGTTTGTFGTVNVTLGYADQLERLANSLTDELDGDIPDTVERLQSQIDSIDDDIADLQARLDIEAQTLFNEFSAADEALRELAFLEDQLAALLG